MFLNDLDIKKISDECDLVFQKELNSEEQINKYLKHWIFIGNILNNNSIEGENNEEKATTIPTSITNFPIYLIFKAVGSMWLCDFEICIFIDSRINILVSPEARDTYELTDYVDILEVLGNLILPIIRNKIDDLNSIYTSLFTGDYYKYNDSHDYELNNYTINNNYTTSPPTSSNLIVYESSSSTDINSLNSSNITTTWQ